MTGFVHRTATRTLPRAALVAAALFALPLKAQTTTPEPELPDPPGIALPPVIEPNTDTGADAGLPALRTQIGKCYTGDPEIAGEEQVRVRFVVDQAGLLLGIPEVVGEDAGSAAARRIFLNAMVALEDCAPYATGGPKTTYEATFGPRDVTALDVTGSEAPAAVLDAAASARTPTFIFASEESEAALDLSRADRREIQQRLSVSGHDPGGADGVFGANTRSAISSWQTEQGYPVSGYLDQPQLDALEVQSETEYQALRASQPATPQRKPERVRVCKRGILGVLYDCRDVWR